MAGGLEKERGQALPVGSRLHEYEVEKVLGEGGFGITYLARDLSLGFRVVIKENLPAQFAFRDTRSGRVLPRSESGTDLDNFHWSMRNFLSEAEILASLDHPGIVKVLRRFEMNGTAYFVMPFEEGTTLDVQINNRRETGISFTEQELSGLLWNLLGILEYLHVRGIYHRDIKPGNVLIKQDGMPLLIDFGSARQLLSERSLTVVESFGYTPFEQLQTRGQVGPWSDLYSLSATLIKAITYDAPVKAADRALTDSWYPLADRKDLLQCYSHRFLACIDRAFSVDIKNRWQDANQWRDGFWGEGGAGLSMSNSSLEQGGNIGRPPLAQGKQKAVLFIPPGTPQKLLAGVYNQFPKVRGVKAALVNSPIMKGGGGFVGPGKNPAGVVLLAILNFISACILSISLLKFDAMRAVFGMDSRYSSYYRERFKFAYGLLDDYIYAGRGLVIVGIVLKLCMVVLLILSGKGYLQGKYFLGRVTGTIFGVVALGYVFFVSLAFSQSVGVVIVVYPIITLVLIHSMYKDRLVN